MWIKYIYPTKIWEKTPLRLTFFHTFQLSDYIELFWGNVIISTNAKSKRNWINLPFILLPRKCWTCHSTEENKFSNKISFFFILVCLFPKTTGRDGGREKERETDPPILIFLISPFYSLSFSFRLAIAAISYFFPPSLFSLDPPTQFFLILTGRNSVHYIIIRILIFEYDYHDNCCFL